MCRPIKNLDKQVFLDEAGIIRGPKKLWPYDVLSTHCMSYKGQKKNAVGPPPSRKERLFGFCGRLVYWAPGRPLADFAAILLLSCDMKLILLPSCSLFCYKKPIILSCCSLFCYMKPIILPFCSLLCYMKPIVRWGRY